MDPVCEEPAEPGPESSCNSSSSDSTGSANGEESHKTTSDTDMASNIEPDEPSTDSASKRATLAVRAFYSPVTSSAFRSKAAAANAFDVSRQMFRHIEKELEVSGVLSNIKSGHLPPPRLPDVHDNGSVTTPSAPGTIEFDMATVEAAIKAKCTRPGDNVKYGTHGLVGMYREGVKWAVQSMHTGNLRKDGRRASELLALMNIKVSDTTLHQKLREYEASLEPDVTVVNVQTPCRTGQRAKLPMRYEVQLVEFVQKLRALNLKAGKSLIVGAANHLIKGTELADLFKDKHVTYAWYYSFRNRYGIKMKNQVRLEMDRKRCLLSYLFRFIVLFIVHTLL